MPTPEAIPPRIISSPASSAPRWKAEVEASLLGLTGGKVTPAVIAAAKVNVARLTSKVAMEPTKAPAHGVVLSPERIAIARQMGRDLKEVEAFEAKRLGVQRLECHRAVEQLVAGEEHLGHATLRDRPMNLVAIGEDASDQAHSGRNPTCERCEFGRRRSEQRPIAVKVL